MGQHRPIFSMMYTDFNTTLSKSVRRTSEILVGTNALSVYGIVRQEFNTYSYEHKLEIIIAKRMRFGGRTGISFGKWTGAHTSNLKNMSGTEAYLIKTSKL